MHKDRNIRHTSCCIQGCLTAIFYDQAMSMSNKYRHGPSALIITNQEKHYPYELL